MENRKWEQRSSEVDLNETYRELESKQLQLQQANLWAENAQRERGLIFVENWKWKIDSSKKVAQKSAKKLRN